MNKSKCYFVVNYLVIPHQHNCFQRWEIFLDKYKKAYDELMIIFIFQGELGNSNLNRYKLIKEYFKNKSIDTTIINYKYHYNIMNAFKKLYKILKNNDSDVNLIHVDNLILKQAFWYFIVLSFISESRKILYFGGPLFPRYRILYPFYKTIFTLLSSLFDRVIFLTKGHYKLSKKIMHTSNPSIIGQYIPLRDEILLRENEKSKEIKYKYFSNEKLFYILFVGRLDWNKGIDIVLKCAKELQQYNIQFTLIGHDCNRIVEKFINKNNLINIDSLGWRDDVNYFYKYADMLLHPSRHEGLPSVVCEALLMKNIVLTSRCGGQVDIIKEGKTGFLADINKSEEWVLKIKEIYKNRNKYSAINDEGYRCIKENFAKDKFSRQLNMFFEDFMNMKNNINYNSIIY